MDNFSFLCVAFFFLKSGFNIRTFTVCFLVSLLRLTDSVAEPSFFCWLEPKPNLGSALALIFGF